MTASVYEAGLYVSLMKCVSSHADFAFCVNRFFFILSIQSVKDGDTNKHWILILNLKSV